MGNKTKEREGVETLMTDYLVFNELFIKGRKTKMFEVRNNTHDTLLGMIGWSGAWRQYIFNQTDNPITTLGLRWSSGCLKQLASFIDNLMLEWKKEKEVES